jgi:hypothetical protein
MSMAEPLLPARFAFRFAAPCRRLETLWTANGVTLPEAHRLPALGELDGRPAFADVRAAWNERGLAITVDVAGKRHPLWSRESKPDDSDGLQVWIDTRDTRNIHRASRFCHRFVFMPAGGGRQYAEPVADQLLVDRAREHATPVRPGALGVRAKVGRDSYHLACFMPAGSLTGFQPEEHKRLGFTYFLFDREFGEQTFSVGTEMPFASDPALWGSLELVA